MIKNNITEIKNIKNESKCFYLLADKAYKTKEEYKLNDKIVKIITPDKKNAVSKKNSQFEKKLFKSRTKIENINCFIKKYERIQLRHKIQVFYEFCLFRLFDE